MTLVDKLHWLKFSNPWCRIAMTLKPVDLVPKETPGPGDTVYRTFVTEPAESLEDADAVTSRVDNPRNPFTNQHKVLLDIDMPAVLVPSTNPEHFHLYIDHTMKWRDYLELLEALAKAGILQEGFVDAAKERGFTTLRTPWTRKGKEKAAAISGEATPE